MKAVSTTIANKKKYEEVLKNAIVFEKFVKGSTRSDI